MLKRSEAQAKIRIDYEVFSKLFLTVKWSISKCSFAIGGFNPYLREMKSGSFFFGYH